VARAPRASLASAFSARVADVVMFCVVARSPKLPQSAYDTASAGVRLPESQTVMSASGRCAKTRLTRGAFR